MNLKNDSDSIRRLINLITRKIMGQTTPEEDAAIEAWRQEDPRNDALLRELLDRQTLGQAFRRREAVDVSRPLADMKARLYRLRPVPLHRRVRFRYGAAAVVAGLVCGVFSEVLEILAKSCEVTFRLEGRTLNIGTSESSSCPRPDSPLMPCPDAFYSVLARPLFRGRADSTPWSDGIKG